MKLIQFIYPMFLVALGLHAAALFVPIGGSSEEAVEDVDLAETEAASERFPSPAPDSSGPADLSAAKTARSGANGAAQPAASSASAVTTRPAVTTIARRALSPQTAVPQASDTPASPNVASSPPANEPPDSTDLPELPADSSPDADESTPAARADDNPPLSAGDLIASAGAKLPASLRSMLTEVAEALTYREAGTSEAIAKRRRDAWEAKIRTQANVDAIENIAPTQVTGLTQVSYPIKSAEDAEVLSYSACLEKDPHNAEVGVLFDSQGNEVGQPELIRSTGYGALNEKILAIFTDVDNFSNLGEALTLEHRRSKAYTFEVVVDYKADACVSLEKLRPVSEDSDG